MRLSKDEIVDYARRYVNDCEVADFVFDGDLFCFLERNAQQSDETKGAEGWRFEGYGICVGYTLDDESKPMGKWIWFYYIDLGLYPPTRQVLKLQPPHAVRGLFQNAERTKDIRIAKIPFSRIGDVPEPSEAETEQPEPEKNAKILKFPTARFPDIPA